MKKIVLVLILSLAVMLPSGCSSLLPALQRESPDTNQTSLTGNNVDATDSTAKESAVDQNAPQQTEETEETEVYFACPELERLVRETIGVTSGPVTSSDMLNLYEIRPNGESISSLVGLEYAINLYDFGILRNEVELESLDPISQLTSLTRINVSYTQVAQPVNFELLDQVYYFALIDTNISDISFLSNMPAIEHLTMTNCGISNIESLAVLDNLEHLTLGRNEISSIDALRNKSNIRVLNIDQNNISDISPLADMINLQEAILSYNPITNLKPLEDLPNLSALTIYQDHDVKHLIFDQIEILENKGVEVDYHR